MGSFTKKKHWERIYEEKDTTTDASWYQNNPETSVDLILSTKAGRDSNIIDVGGGDSKLVDRLLKLGFKKVFVLDISARALKKAKTRLKSKAGKATWIESDILKFDTEKRFDIWHDRATFHFLTKKRDISRYVKIASKLVKSNGYVVISTFSVSGPKECSGLNITQYSKGTIKRVFEKDFKFIKGFGETHTTPFDTKQQFLWSVFKKKN